MQGPPAVELAWSRGAGADSCIDGGELAGKVEATIGRPVLAVAPQDASARPPDGSVASPDAGPPRLEGHVQPLGSGWIAVVEVRAVGSALRREVALDAPDCRQLDEALVLVVALMAEAAQPSAPRLTLPIRRASPSVGIGPDVSVAAGMLPGIAAGFGVATEVALLPLWHLAAWAHAWPRSDAMDAGSGGRMTAWTLGAGPCIGPVEHESRSFFGCVGASGGVVYASGLGLELPRTSSRPYLQGEFRVGFRFWIGGPMSARLEVGVGLPISRDSYQFFDADRVPHPLFRTAAIVPLGRFAVEFRAP